MKSVISLSSDTGDVVSHACAHCGLPAGRHPAETGPYFCCSGCEMVFHTLREAGFDETYYRLRDRIPAEATPARTEIDPLLISELDSAAFLDAHTTRTGEDARSTELFLDGVHCAACVWLVERLPYEMPGVTEARLDLPRARLSITWQPGRVALSDVALWLASVGYQAHPTRSDVSGRTGEERRLLTKVGVCWALAGNVMLLAFALYAGLDATHNPDLATAARWLSLILAVPSVAYGGSEFFRRAAVSIRQAWHARSARSLHMDTPIALGILVGSTQSVWATVSGRGDVWFDSITVLIAALLSARWLQLRSRRLAGDASERLLSLVPTMARKYRADGSTETIPATSLRPGEYIEVRADEVIPVDGALASEAASVNMAVLTGESRPVHVSVGEPLAAGATNLSSHIRVCVEATGEDTRIGKLLSWVRDASSHRAPVVLLADRLSGYFVLAVLGLAAATAFMWMFFAPEEVGLHVVALLVITCPCALGMATPLAMAVASGKAARRGIFIKSDEAIQQLTSVDTVVLDKTGTLTEGRLDLVSIEGDPGAAALAAALERQSSHPLATAFLNAFPDADLPVTNVASEPGNGLRGCVDGHDVIVGRPAWVVTKIASPNEPLLRRSDAIAADGYTPVAAVVDGKLTAVLAFGDRIRADSAALVDRLHAEGMDVYLLSGDHAGVVSAVAASLGIPADRVRGGVGPEEKKAFIEAIQRDTGATVAMIGDGVNDAAALGTADVGIAVEGSSTAGMVASDVFITRGGLAPLTDLLSGARRVMHVIQRNLGISLVYNVAGAGAAMAGLVSPFVAAIAMPVSSLVVVASSILQRSFQAPKYPARMDSSTQSTSRRGSNKI